METRKTTNKLLELIDAGMISARDVVTMCLKWMSEDDVADMCRANDVYSEEDDE